MAAIPQPEPKDWIRANAQVLAVTDREVLLMLLDSSKAVNRMLLELVQRDSGLVSDGIRRAQLEQTRALLLAEQAKVFTRLGMIVEARRADAASRSRRLDAANDNELLRKVGKGAESQYLYESALHTSQRAIDAALARMKLSALPLSQRIYRTGVWMGDRLSKLINETLATGLNAREFAKVARDWFNPNTPGGVRFAAMRLARTEINNSFHAMSAQKYDETPWIRQVEWNLSGSHPKPDECNVLADASPYDPKQTPARPHPQCMCFITPVSEDEDDFVENFLKGDYDEYLDNELEKNGWQVEEKLQPAPEPVQLKPTVELKPTLSGRDAMESVPKGLFKRGSMKPDQREALKVYETGWFVVIQDFLRTGYWGNPDYKTEERDIGRIDSAMAGSILPNDIQVWRGMFNSGRIFGEDMKGKNLAGFAWEEKGYSSTTANEGIVELFNVSDDQQYEDKLGQNVKMTVTVPAGTQALATSSFEKGSKENGPQAEITLQRGMKWTVVKDNGYDRNGVRQLEVRADPIRREIVATETNEGATERNVQPADIVTPNGSDGSGTGGGAGSGTDGGSVAIARRDDKRRAQIDEAAEFVEGIVKVEGDGREEIITQMLAQARLTPTVIRRLMAVSKMTDAESKDLKRRFGSTAIGGYTSELRSIAITPEVFRDSYEKQFSREVKNGFLSHCEHGHQHDGLKSFVAHEYGHHVEDIIRVLGGDRAMRPVIRAAAEAMGINPPALCDRQSVNRWVAKNIAVISKKVSRYGSESGGEMLAEVWAEYSSNPDARPHIKKIGEAIKAAAEPTG